MINNRSDTTQYISIEMVMYHLYVRSQGKGRVEIYWVPWPHSNDFDSVKNSIIIFIINTQSTDEKENVRDFDTHQVVSQSAARGKQLQKLCQRFRDFFWDFEIIIRILGIFLGILGFFAGI